jgi:hypothetical protein
MDDPANHLTWETDDGGLGRAEARALRKAVDTCAHWLEVWNSFVRAGVARPVTLVVAMHDGDGVVLTADRDAARLRVAVPKALSGGAGLQYAVVTGALEAVEAAAQMFPHSPLPTFWQRPVDEEPGRPGAVWEGLEPEEMLLFSNYVDANSDGPPIGELLDRYIWERVNGTGIAEVVDTSGQEWTIALR